GEAADEQERRRGGEQAEQLAHRHAAVTVEVGQQSAEGGDAGAEERRPPVQVPPPGRRAAVGRAENRRCRQVSPIAGHVRTPPPHNGNAVPRRITWFSADVQGRVYAAAQARWAWRRTCEGQPHAGERVSGQTGSCRKSETL